MAYKAGGLSPLAGVAVTALVGGADLGQVSTGANGYFYVLAPAGTIDPAGLAVLGLPPAARIETETGSVGGFDLRGGALIAPTGALTYSAASATPLKTQYAALIAQAAGADTAAIAFVDGLGAGATSPPGPGSPRPAVDCPAWPLSRPSPPTRRSP